MANVAYPLKQVLEVKQKRVEDAEKLVQEKRLALQKEQEKLVEREKERDKAIKHHTDKLMQLRHSLDEGTTSDKILQMKAYLKVAKERVKVEEKKVKEQQDQVEIANKNLQAAQLELRLKRQEVDKMHTHRQDWEKQMRKEEEIIEGREQDEIGTVIFSAKQRLSAS
jgi:flagellar biosynthesis chaperone FliJ